MRRARLAMALSGLLWAAAGPVAMAEEPEAVREDPVLAALVAEMGRSMDNLRNKEEEPLYYLAYRVHDGRNFSLSASFGALTDPGDDDPDAGRNRILDVSCRVGTPELDNTHKLRGDWSWGGNGASQRLPIEDDQEAVRVAVWRATDRAYKGAVRQLIRVKANKAVKVEEEDKAADFSPAQPQIHIDERVESKVDLEDWKGRLTRLSAMFKEHPHILSSSVGISGGIGTMYFVDSDGARVRAPRRYYRVTMMAEVKADDGMDLSLFDSFEAISPEQLPTEEQVAEKVRALIAQLMALRDAPVVEPYAGPAIIMNRATAVFFHEIFGHRIEGHRQKDEDEGQTFTKKVGQRIMPEFISVTDDPTRGRWEETVLNGKYAIDEEGVPAESVALVENGVLSRFLMGRSPIEGFDRSNGHGRAQPGNQPVARQGNLLVTSSTTLPFADLRKRLVEEIGRQGKPYGLMFAEISGGFTFTGRFLPQSFKVMPQVVFRVYADGRPDELVRGVDLVGTPLASLEKILAAGDDYEVFNGYCGAESGWVPVSAVAPSILVAEMEVEKKQKGFEKHPILPPPLHPGTEWPGTEGETPGGGQ